MLNHDQVESRLQNALTNYDKKQSTKRSYNVYALGLYLGQVAEVMKQVRSGIAVEIALQTCFCDRLLDICLKAVRA